MKKALIIAIGVCIALLANAQKHPLKNLPKKVQKQLSNMVFIKGDTLTDIEYAVPAGQRMGDLQQTPRAVVADFYMLAYEVSNKDWLDFHRWYAQHNDKAKANAMLPDTNCWRTPNFYNQPYVEYYYRHPAYHNYPVLGVSYTQAQEYANWKNRTIDSTLKANNVTSYTIKFRLPTANEMEYVLQWKYNGQLISYKSGLQYRCNFGAIKDTFGFNCKPMLGIGPHDVDNADITAPVKSYWPNALGIYNIRGNVAEWTSTPIQTFAADPKGAQHLVKGGSWIDGPYYLQEKTYTLMYADSSDSHTGFRLVMDIVEVKPLVTK